MSQLSALMNYSEDLQPNSVDIRTEYLEPISSSTYKYTFRLDQMGYLDTNSMLVFKNVAGTHDTKCRVNSWNGVLGQIKRVIFQVGDNIINDVQDIYKYATLKNMNVAPSMRNQFHGKYLGNQFVNRVQTFAGEKPVDGLTTRGTYAENETSRTGAIVYDHGASGADLGKADGSSTGIVPNSFGLSTNKANNHQMGITLGMLIPALKGQKIPLFLFDKQRILLTFEFNTSEKFGYSLTDPKLNYASATNNNPISSSTDITPTDVRMVIDYIVVPTDVQNELIAQTQKQGGYRLEFYDVVNVEKNIPLGSNGVVQEVEHRIGQNNREVHNIIMWKEVANDVYNGGDLGGGKIQSRGNVLLGLQKCAGYSKEEYNCNIDGKDEFDHFVFNPVSQYNELSAVLGSDFKVPRTMYCADDNTTHSRLSTLDSGLLGTMKPLGLSLRNGLPQVVGGGRMIGQYPIVWKWRRTCHNAVLGTNPVQVRRDDEVVKVNYFCEVSRVANILQTPKGTNVIVSY